MRWIALIKIHDRKKMSEWHSGSCTTYKSKANLKTKKEASEFINEVINIYDGEEGRNKLRSEYDKYQLTHCILSYDESQSENIEAFFKYMY